MTQAQHDEKRGNGDQISKRQQRHRRDGAQRDFGNNVLAAPKHKGGEQGNQTALIHTEPSLLRLKGTAQDFIRTSEKSVFHPIIKEKSAVV
ncbi:MAG: hypothetical protein ACLR07_08380 [Christensenellales bacterium]